MPDLQNKYQRIKEFISDIGLATIVKYINIFVNF